MNTRTTTGVLMVIAVAMVGAGAFVWLRPSREISNAELILDCSNLGQLDSRKQTTVREELIRRVKAGSLSDQEFHDATVAVLSRLVQSDEIADADVQVINTFSGRTAPDVQIREVARRLPFKLTADYPAYSTSIKVPADVQTWAFIEVEQFSARLVGSPPPCLRARAVGQEEWTVRSARAGVHVPVPPLPAGSHSVQFEVQVGDMTETGEFQAVRTAVAKRDVEAVHIPVPAMKASAEMEAALRGGLRVTLEDHEVGDHLLRIEPVLHASTIGTSAEELGLDLRLQIDIVCGDVVVARTFFVPGIDEAIAVPRSWMSRPWKYFITGEWCIPGVDGENAAERSPLWSGRIEKTF